MTTSPNDDAITFTINAVSDGSDTGPDDDSSADHARTGTSGERDLHHHPRAREQHFDYPRTTEQPRLSTPATCVPVEPMTPHKLALPRLTPSTRGRDRGLITGK